MTPPERVVLRIESIGTVTVISAESEKLVPLDVKAGDRVLFGKWSGTEVKIDGEDLLIVKESDVMCVIEGVSVTKKKAA